MYIHTYVCYVHTLLYLQVSVSVYNSHEDSPSPRVTEHPTTHPPTPPQHNHTLNSASPVTHRDTTVTTSQLSTEPMEPSPETSGVAGKEKNTVSSDHVEQHRMLEEGGVQPSSRETDSSRLDTTSVADDGTSVGRTSDCTRQSVNGKESESLRDRREEEGKQGGGGHSSDYHTPSPISDQHLRELSRSDADPAGPHSTEVAPPTESVVEEESEAGTVKVKEGECTDGIVFQPHSFPYIEPTTTATSQENTGGVVRPNPRPLRPEKPVATEESEEGQVTSAFTRLEPSREPIFVEDGSTVSSVASSFRDTSHRLQKDYSSLSLDRHSDVEESGFHADGQAGVGGAGIRHRGDTVVRWGHVEEGEGSAYLFPVSNSPVDLVTMLTRLASFTSTLLSTLTPRLRQAVPGLDEPRVW